MKNGDYTSVAIREDGSVRFATLQSVLDYAGLIQRSGMLPKGLSVESASIAIIAGAGLGLNPFASIQGIASINGRPSVWGDALLALVMGSGLVEDQSVEYIKGDGDCVVRYTIKRRGVKTAYVGEFGKKDAERAQLWGKPGPWTQYPKRMMLNRARAFALRDGFADVLKGMRIAEEEQDATTVVVADYETTKTPPVAERKLKPSASSLLEEAMSATSPTTVASEAVADGDYAYDGVGDDKSVSES